jgi:hypothetical protein
MRWGFILFLCLASSVLAGTTDDAIPDARYLDYATGFAPYTLRLVARDPSGRLMTASAVAIAPHYALTAAHVAADIASCTLASGNKTVPVRQVWVHGEWQDTNLGVADIAILRTGEAFGLGFYPTLCDGGEEVGEVVSIAGWGITGRLSTGHTHTDGRLRAGTNTIERFERAVIVCLAKPGSSPLEYCIAPGCSGGPLFVGGRLAGINSFTSRDAGTGKLRSGTGEESGHTRVSLYREWILSIAGAELDATSTVAAWNKTQ